MPEHLKKIFTRDFSLLTCQWLRQALIERFAETFYVGYSDWPAGSDGLCATFYRPPG
ncbi:MAG: hypothetical protein V1708_06030 [Candidatus Micrarchaeota archaeon]